MERGIKLTDNGIDAVYDIENFIDVKYVEDIINKNLGKEIICFGGGTAADIIMQKILYKYKVYCFLDNNKSIQGTKLYDVEVKAPDILKNLETGSFLVLIVSKHVNAISKQLEELGLENNKDYFDIYNKFLPYFRVKKFVSYAKRFEKFINSIPDGKLDTIPVKKTKRIGIVCIAEMIQLVSWYPIVQCILLRYRGYQVSLIVDCLHSFDDYIFFDGITEIASLYINYIVKKVKEKWPSFEVFWIDGHEQECLDDKDINMTKKFAPVVIKWFDSRRDEVFLSENKNRISKAEELLQNTMKSIKAFFLKEHFDVINVQTGIHRHRCVYTYIGKKLGIRVATYDGDEKGVIVYATDGVAGWSYSIREVIDGNYFTQDEKKELVEIAKQNFNMRRYSTSDDKGYNFQKVKVSEINKKYDVLIPLNIQWDAAALGLDYIFSNEVEWLQQTLEYLMLYTDVSVMVREHPAQRFDSDVFYKDYKKELPIINDYTERIVYVYSDADINTYQYIEQCKLVLPYSSTTGLEAIIMGKPIVVHTNVYYDKYVCKANNKEDYFEKITQYLTNNVKNEICNDNVYLAYLYGIYYPITTRWSEYFDDWLDYSIEELNSLHGVNEIVNIIIYGIPSSYSNLKEKLNKK